MSQSAAVGPPDDHEMVDLARGRAPEPGRPRRPAPVARDMFKLLVQAESEKPLLARHGDLAPWGIEQADLDAFLAGYGPLPEPADDTLMRFFQLSEVLRRWAMLIGRRRDRFVHPVMAARLRRMASHALALRR